MVPAEWYSSAGPVQQALLVAATGHSSLLVKQVKHVWSSPSISFGDVVRLFHCRSKSHSTVTFDGAIAVDVVAREINVMLHTVTWCFPP